MIIDCEICSHRADTSNSSGIPPGWKWSSTTKKWICPFCQTVDDSWEEDTLPGGFPPDFEE